MSPFGVPILTLISVLTSILGFPISVEERERECELCWIGFVVMIRCGVWRGMGWDHSLGRTYFWTAGKPVNVFGRRISPIGGSRFSAVAAAANAARVEGSLEFASNEGLLSMGM